MCVVFGCGFARVTVKESFHKPGSVAKETIPISDGKTTAGCWMSQQRQNWLWIGRCIGKSPEPFTIYFGQWAPRREVNISSTFHCKTGKRYQNLKSQSTQCQTAMPVKYIISLCSPFSERCQAEATKAGSKCSRWKCKQGKQQSQAYTKGYKISCKAHLFPNWCTLSVKVSFAEAQTKVSELELQKKKNKVEKKTRTSTTRTPRKTKAWKRMVRTRHRNDVSDEVVVQSAGQTESLSTSRLWRKLLQGSGNGRGWKILVKERKNVILPHQTRSTLTRKTSCKK